MTWHIMTIESTVRHDDLTLPRFALEVAARTLDRERKSVLPCDVECRCAKAVVCPSRAFALLSNDGRILLLIKLRTMVYGYGYD